MNQVSYLFSLRGTRNHAVRNKGKIGRITLFIFFGFLSIHILFNEETGDGSNDYDSNNNYGNYDCFLGFFTYFYSSDFYLLWRSRSFGLIGFYWASASWTNCCIRRKLCSAIGTIALFVRNKNSLIISYFYDGR